jgi:hypothetical protein
MVELKQYGEQLRTAAAVVQARHRRPRVVLGACRGYVAICSKES